MTTIDTSTSSAASAFSNQRKTDRCQNGVLWSVFHAGSGVFEFHYSTDDGATFTHDASGDISSGGSTANGSLFIDLDDYAHFVHKDGSDSQLYYQRGTPNAGRTAWTWSSATNIANNTDANHPDVVAHRDGTGWKVHIVHTLFFATVCLTHYARLGVSATGTITAELTYTAHGSTATTIGGGYSVSATTRPSIDFNHTGDSKTVSGSTPHLYAAWSVASTGTGLGVRFRRATYSGGTWTWGTERSIDTASYANSGRISSCFDGTRVLIAYVDSGATSTVKIRERDAADTTTTSRTPTALSDGEITAVSVSYDGDGGGDIHLWAIGTTSDDVKRIEYDRSAGTWDGSWTTVAAADGLADTLSLKRGFSDATIDAVYTTGTGSPYDVVHASYAINSAPMAATWNLADNQARDVAAALVLDWTFSDPDAGDTQSKYALRRQVGAGSLEYWNAGTATWGASEVENTSSTTQVVLAATWGADTDANHKYAVKTWDAAGLVGSYGSDLTVIPSAKDNPTISSPADAGTVTAPSVTVSWSAATQTAYRARLLTSTGGEIESSGWVTSTATSHAFATTLANSTSYQVEVTTKNDEGLASTADTSSFTVSFTPPATPTLVVTGSDANGYITVAINNPGTGATEASNDVYVRVAAGGRADLDRPVGGDGIRIGAGVAVDGSFIDRAVASGVSYEYRAKAVADTGATAWSAWT